METTPALSALGNQGVVQPPEAPPLASPRIIYLLRHGQSTFNVEGRLPGQLDGVVLTDEGRRQAYRAAVALSGVPLATVIASPLERALETAQIVAKGGGLDVRVDARLKDTDVGGWAGQKIGDLEKNDPTWKAFVEHPDKPPPGVESLAQVQQRAVAVVEELKRDASVGNFVALVSHADVVKLILAHYMRMHIYAVRYVAIGTASISALAFQGAQPPHVLAVNWTPLPEWLAPPPSQPVARDAAEQPPEGPAAPAGQAGRAVHLEHPSEPAPPYSVS
jgi:broad specificity phosphatase PhoE